MSLYGVTYQKNLAPLYVTIWRHIAKELNTFLCHYMASHTKGTKYPSMSLYDVT